MLTNTFLRSILAATGLLYCLHSQAQQLPTAYQTDFTYAGYNDDIPLPSSIIDVTTSPYNADRTGQADCSAAINSAIAAAEGSVVYLPEGKYLIRNTLTINKSNVILRGAGSDKTRLIFDLSGSADPIVVKGGITSSSNAYQYLSATAKRGSKSISLTNDALAIVKANSLALLYQDPGLKAYPGDSWAQTANSQQMLHVESVTGKTVTFKEPLRRDFTTGSNAYIRVVQPVRNVGLEDFYLECKNKQYSDAEQTSSPANDNIVMDYADSCWIVGVESKYSNGAHVDVRRSANVQISGCYFHSAHGWGGGGSGYGVCLTGGATQVLVANCIFDSLRHAMLIQGFSNGNVFAYNYSAKALRTDANPYDAAGDLILHGNYPHSNLYQGNIGSVITVDNPHGANGPRNVFLRNQLTGYGVNIWEQRTTTDAALQQSAAGIQNDSTVLIGNDITRALQQVTSSYSYGSYKIFSGSKGNIEIGNKRQGALIVGNQADAGGYKSLYNPCQPLFWDIADSWYGIGTTPGSSIPAKVRFENSSAKKTDSRKKLFMDYDAPCQTQAQSDTCVMRSFRIGNYNGVIKDSTVSLKMPQGTNLKSLTPTILVSPKASVSPASGQEQDFTNTVIYTVTAENGVSKRRYYVSVELAAATAVNAVKPECSLYPNPFDNEIYVDINVAQVDFVSLNGLVALSAKPKGNVVNTATLSSGTYVIKSILKNGNIASQIMVKSN